ncbi:hypothetical protein [Aestuariivirga sp.]|uniref:hypothetical protein n=1 Tax=Aestuariivirga sp. TaxID=2650926 RepID=UPI0039E69A77
MQTAVTQAFRRIRRTDAVLDIHIAGDDMARAEQVAADLDADYEVFATLPAVTARDVTLKAKEAISSLRAFGYDNEAEIARAFFGQRQPRDAAWLNDLRTLIAGLELLAPGDTYALTCLRSIIAGLGKPRLV